MNYPTTYSPYNVQQMHRKSVVGGCTPLFSKGEKVFEQGSVVPRNLYGFSNICRICQRKMSNSIEISEHPSDIVQISCREKSHRLS